MTIGELLALIGLSKPQPAQAPPDGFNAERPWDSPVVQAPPVSPQTITPQPSQTVPLDPFTYAQQMEERQRAAAKLSAPVSPVLSLLDILNTARR